MSQHDLEIANQTFPATRSDLNNALQALGSLQSGATAPSTTYANMLWYDTANDRLYLRNEADTQWIHIFDANQSSQVIELVSKLKAPNGSSSLPSITFASDADTGLYRSSANTIGMTLGGNDNYEFTSTGTTTISGTGAFLTIDDTNGTTANTVNAVRFDASGASAGYVGMSGSSTFVIKNYNTSGGLIKMTVDTTDVVTVSETGVSVTGTFAPSGDYSSTDGDITLTNGDITATNGTVTANTVSATSYTGLPSFSVEGRSDAIGNDTTISLSANTVLVLGEVYISTSASLGARVSVELKDSGGTVVDSFDLLGMNENNGTDGGSGMSGRVNFTVAVPDTVTQIRFYRSSGSRTVDGTVNQFLKYS